MGKIQGGCLCGAVRYHADGEAVMVAICQCTHCQRQSGAAYSVNVGIAKGSLQFSGDIPATYEDRGSSGRPVHRRFCAKCGSPIVSQVDASADLDWLKAGTLDDASWVRPQAAVWCRSAQPWVELPAELPQFPQNPPSS